MRRALGWRGGAPSRGLGASGCAPGASPRALAALVPRAARPTSWVDASKQAVSQESLAGIPWAGRSTLAGLFVRVAMCDRKDPAVWKRLVARADVIAHSFTAKQASLVLSAMARVKHTNASFLRRFTVKCVPSLVEDAELLDLCGIISSLSQLNGYCEESFSLAVGRLIAFAPQMDLKQISLVANAYIRVGHPNAKLFRALLKQVPRRIARCSGKDAAVLLNALAQFPAARALASADDGALADDEDGMVDDQGSDDASSRPTREGQECLLPGELRTVVEAVTLRLPELLPSADLHTLTLLLNALAQLRFAQKDVTDLLTEELLANEARFQRMTGRQLAMILNSAARLQLFDPRLLDAMVSKTRQQAGSLDSQALCLVANASAKLQFGLDTFQALYAQVPRHLARLSGRQLAMVCHAWAKAHVHNDDLFSLLALPLAQRTRELGAREVAIAVYGYAHFKKAPPELFTPLLERFAELRAQCKASQAEVLMIGNALGRVGWRDSAVAEGLEAYARREPSLRNLSAQARATYSLEPQ